MNELNVEGHGHVAEVQGSQDLKHGHDDGGGQLGLVDEVEDARVGADYQLDELSHQPGNE